MRLKIDDVVDHSKAEAKTEDVIGMIKEGLGLDIIARVTHLTVDQVSAIDKQAVWL